MATFTFPADFVAERKNEPRVRKTSFADGGYEQRIRFGLNSNPKTFNLTFENRSDSERDQILAFLDDAAGADSFDWTTPINDRRNLLTFTEDLTLPLYSRRGLSSISTGQTGYLGAQNAFGLLATAISEPVRGIFRQISVAAGATTTSSIYVRPIISRAAKLYQIGGTSQTGVYVDLTTGGIQLDNTGNISITWGAERVGSSGWWRIWATGNPSSTQRLLVLDFTDASAQFTFTGQSTTPYVYVMAPQIENGNLSAYQPILTEPRSEKYVCETYNTRYLSCNNNTITATFRQVFDL